MRCFSGTKWKKNLGEARAECRTFYPVLADPNGAERSGVRAQRGRATSEAKKFNLLAISSQK